MPQLVKYTSGKKRFEVLTKDGSVKKFREGKLGWNNVLFADQVFTDSKKGNVAKDKDLKSVFGTSDLTECLIKIILEGELSVSAKERKEDMKRHKQAVIGHLHRTYVDAGNLPHPLTRLEAAVNDSKVRIDPGEQVEKQANDIVKAMSGKLVFRKNTVEYTVAVSHTYARKASSVIYQYCEVNKENWEANGCVWTFGIGASEFDKFMAALNKITNGDYQLTTGIEKKPQLKDNNGKQARSRKKEKRKKQREKRLDKN
jgi:ribosome maturation protein SDO1